jgi:hypothetical protein
MIRCESCNGTINTEYAWGWVKGMLRGVGIVLHRKCLERYLRGLA